ncbi:MAG: gluconate 2-dehydrogenase subunit 3 family protein [Chitinispirillaceae bacterium]|jgi:hypothetical protein|nr:gluconate 2-dehydrogenase subunit 3 family protein [Chitinispirillaceae bacterium]
MKKRSFITAILSFAAFWLFTPRNDVMGFFSRSRNSPLSEKALKNLALAAECVFPGALALGIESFFAHQQGVPYFGQQAPFLRRLAVSLDAYAREEHAQNFSSLPPDKRTRLCEKIAPSSSADFSRFVDLTIEGCMSSPIHGGNRNAAAWKLLGDSFKGEWFNG